MAQFGTESYQNIFGRLTAPIYPQFQSSVSLIAYERGCSFRWSKEEVLSEDIGMVAERLTPSEYSLSSTPRETCGEVSLAGHLIISEADVSIDSMYYVVGRQRWHLRVRVRQ